MNNQRSSLFASGSMHQLTQSRGEQLDAEIAAYDSNRLLNTPSNDLAKYYSERFRIDIPSIDADGVTVEQREGAVQVYDHFAEFRGRGRHDTMTVPGTIITVSVPFVGEKSYFNIQPSTYGSMRPRAEISGRELVFTVSGRDLQQDAVRQEITGFIASVEQHLGWQRPDADRFNSQLFDRALRVIDARKAKLLAAQSLVSGLGFKMKERSDSAKTYSAPNVQRKIEVRPPSASSAPFKPEPVLDEDHYQHILGVISNMTAVFERSPAAFKTMDEEAIRQHYLVQLNGHYEGGATGETFNFQGKTDILIRADGKNIFIGECKFWQGEKIYLETISQVLSYLSWRDTKAAVIVFNRNKDFSRVLETIKTATITHKGFKSGPKVEGTSRFRYIFKSNQDESREIILTVVAFDVPS